jgi:hypothetical protein
VNSTTQITIRSGVILRGSYFRTTISPYTTTDIINSQWTNDGAVILSAPIIVLEEGGNTNFVFPNYLYLLIVLLSQLKFLFTHPDMEEEGEELEEETILLIPFATLQNLEEEHMVE